MFFFHLPVVLGLALWMVYMKNSYKYDDSTNVLVSMIYFGVVIFMSVILVVWAITKKCQYCKQLKGREE